MCRSREDARHKGAGFLGLLHRIAYVLKKQGSTNAIDGSKTTLLADADNNQIREKPLQSGNRIRAVGRWLGFSPRRVKALIPIGASAALAAAFNTPIAAALFTVEEVMGDMH